MNGKKITIRGIPEEEGGILKAYNVHLLEDGEVIPRVQKFEFVVDAMSGIPMVNITQYPGEVDFELEGVAVHKEIKHTRIFDECTEVMKSMDYDFRLAIKKKGKSWKTTDPEQLKEYLDTCYESLNTIMEQYMKGERNILDVALFAVKLANYSVLLADRTYIIHRATESEKEEKEKKTNADSDKVQKPKM